MNKQLQDRVDEAFSADNFAEAKALVLINDLADEVKRLEDFQNAGFMLPERCTNDCLNYHGALADANHFEA